MDVLQQLEMTKAWQHGTPAYVISLPGGPRNSLLIGQLERQGFFPILVEAVDGRDGSARSLDSRVDQKTFFGIHGRMPTGPEIGCALSHLLVAKLAHQAGHESVLVVEEDAQIVGNISGIASRFAEFGEPSILTLFSLHPPVFRSKIIVGLDMDVPRALGRIFLPAETTVGYFINRSAIKLTCGVTLVKGLADWPPWSYHANFYACYPWPLSHSSDGSQIQPGRTRLPSPVGRNIARLGAIGKTYDALLSRKARTYITELGGLQRYAARILIPRLLRLLTRLSK